MSRTGTPSLSFLILRFVNERDSDSRYGTLNMICMFTVVLQLQSMMSSNTIVCIISGVVIEDDRDTVRCVFYTGVINIYQRLD